MKIGRIIALAAILLVVACAFAFWFLTRPQRLDAETLAAVGEGDAGRGERMFWAGGCSSCHAAPDAADDARFNLAGGVRLDTDFGTFVAPNISQHEEDGIGAWSVEDFANAMLRGVSPGGNHYYPAFPYTSYTRMSPSDVGDLYAFLSTLPAVEGEAAAHELGFPYSFRRGLGLWKLLYLDDGPAVALESPSEQVALGQYLVEGAGHCGECHTPRNLVGASDTGQWLAGAEAAEGDGNVPNITPGEDGIGGWSEADIVTMLETGFTPEFDSVGGDMAAVQRHMAQLPASDREAIAAYLKAIPDLPDGYSR